MLNFKKGDVIQITDKPDLEEGWFFGIFAGRSGYFPAEYVTHIKEVCYLQSLGEINIYIIENSIMHLFHHFARIFYL
jgi:hypothetical protein